MNTAPTIPDTTTLAGDAAPVTVALHLGLPRLPIAEQLGFSSPFIPFLLIGALNAALESELDADGKLGLAGDAYDGLIQFQTTQREAAVRKLLRFIAREEIFVREFFTVAWLCPAEQAWRVVKQGFDPSSFESRLTDERAARRATVTVQRVAHLDHLLRLTANAANQPTE